MIQIVRCVLIISFAYNVNKDMYQIQKVKSVLVNVLMIKYIVLLMKSLVVQIVHQCYRIVKNARIKQHVINVKMVMC